MKEINLQLYWLSMSRKCRNLRTVNGDLLNIIYGGEINFNQGPDFLHARIEIGGMLWVGSVEIHINSSDWFHHKHDHDDFYRNVILHVVWKHNMDSFDRCPTLELSRFMHLFPTEQSSPFIIDNFSTGRIDMPPVEMLENMGMERIERKAHAILLDLKSNECDWHVVFWKKVFYAFGLPLNGAAFEAIFDSVKPFLNKRIHVDAYHLKCIMLGQAGMFEWMGHQEIQTFHLLKNAYNIKDCHVLLMKFRMRPMNFPEKRILEYLELYLQYNDLMQAVLASDYMITELFREIKEVFGKSLYERMCINVFTPFLIAYASFTGNLTYRRKAIEWISSLDPENNHITRRYVGNDVGLTALHTQGLLAHANSTFIHVTN